MKRVFTITKGNVKFIISLAILAVILAGSFSSAYSQVLAGGRYHSAVLCSDSTIWTTGANSYGQLGDGTNISKANPTNNPILSGVTSVVAGFNHTLVTLADSTVWGWGRNGNGQLGDGTKRDTSLQVKAVGLSRIIAIEAGGSFSVALKDDGTVWAWGRNNSGQLGNGTTTDTVTPIQLLGIDSVAAISAGQEHCLALRFDGTVWAWGLNSAGQLGDGTTVDKTSPVRVPISKIMMIAAGNKHSLALSRDGNVFAWGWNFRGQLGDGTNIDKSSPVKIPSFAGNVVAIAAGDQHSLALLNTNFVNSWGFNMGGQLGNNSTIPSNVPVSVAGLATVSAISAGYSHSMALQTSGNVQTWGDNDSAQLGDGTQTDRLTFVNMPLLCTPICHWNRFGVSLTTWNYDVNFVDTSWGNPYIWYWSYSSGDTSHLGTHTYTYPPPIMGPKNATMKVANSCRISSILKFFGLNCPPTIAGYSFSANELTLNFTDTSYNSSEWVWDFGDGNTDTIENPQHVYATDGLYKVCVSIDNPCVNSPDSTCKMINVTCNTPVSGFSSSATNLDVDFTDTSQAAVAWAWDFGDGNNDVAQHPSHTYTAAGTYSVCLLITNLCGDTNSVCNDVTVVCSVPNADFTTSVNGADLTVTDASTNAYSWAWDYGDGNTDNVQSPSPHKYALANTYTVCLTVENECADPDSTCKVVVITGVDLLNDNGLNTFSIFPNPVYDEVVFHFEMTKTTSVNLSVLNSLGESIYQVTQLLEAGEQQIPFETTEIPAGIYIVRVQNENDSGYVKRFVKFEIGSK